MKSILILHSPHEPHHGSFELDFARFPNAVQCWAAENRKEAVEFIRRFRPSIVVLYLDRHIGLDFGVFEQTQALAYQKIIICNTADCGLKRIRYDIDDCLLKPVGKMELEGALEKLLFRTKKYKIQQLYNQRTSNNLATLTTAFVPSTTGPIVIELKDLVRIEDQGDLRALCLRDGLVAQTHWSFKRLVSLVAGNSFVRVAIDQAINCKHIVDCQTIGDRLHVVMYDGHALRIPNAVEPHIHRKMKHTDRA
jgi:DNA-binding LytR/AlgR family response regulator